MAKYKRERTFTVSSVYDRDCDKVRPAIRLTGEWLRELGFEKGSKLRVLCEGGRLTIELDNEYTQER